MDSKPLKLLLWVVAAGAAAGGLVFIGLKFGRSQVKPAPLLSSAVSSSSTRAPSGAGAFTPVFSPPATHEIPGLGAIPSVAVLAAANPPPAGAGGGAGMFPFVPPTAGDDGATVPAIKKGIAEEEETTVSREVGRTPTAENSPYRNVHVLSIGVNIELPGVGGKQQFAVNDAEAIGRVFQQRYGFERVTVLRDAGATRASIFNALERVRTELARNPGQDDFIFFFSGHGFTKTVAAQMDGKDAPVRHGFLVPYEPGLNGDAALDEWRQRAVDMKELTTLVIDLPARHRLMFIDSCFSGLAFAEQAVIRRPAEEAYHEVIQHPTCQVMTAGLESESALEDPRRQHGVFTYSLLQQIEGSAVRTMEEVFFPLRAMVRDELGRHGGGVSMTPQHRYLKYAEGTFVFVPTEWVNRWTEQRPPDGASQLATRQGYFEPVRPEELQEINQVATTNTGRALQIDSAWQERVERYEARASLGDPYAMAALSRMYDSGMGAERDEGRSRLWAQESREVFQYSQVLGITDPNVAKMVDGFINNDEAMAKLVGEENVEKSRQDLQKGIELFAKLKSFFGGDGGKVTVENIEKQRLSIVRDLQDNGRNRNARDRLARMEEQFRELAAAFGDEAKPREFNQVSALLTRAKEHIELGVQAPAIRALEDVGRLLESIKAEAPEAPDERARK